MDITSVYNFLFESYAGIGVLIGLGLVISVVICVFWEIKTRKTYVDRGPADDDDDWSLFGDDDDDDEDEDEDEDED